ncbi:hypothetical protein [Haloferax mucosum]|nr:hypothetical protein [Haloferax mucosum]
MSDAEQDVESAAQTIDDLAEGDYVEVDCALEMFEKELPHRLTSSPNGSFCAERSRISSRQVSDRTSGRVR